MFAGGFPSAFLNLLCIQYIDLSRNDLSGIVPQLGNLIMLEELDLSYNNFEGEIPTSGIFLNSTVVHLDGNKRLCSNLSILALPPCGGSAKTKNHVPFLPVLVPVVTVVFLLLLLVLFTLWKEMEVHSPSLHRRWNLFYSVTHWIKQVCVFPQLHMVRNILCFLTLGRREIGIYPSYQEALKKVSYSDIAKATKWFSPVHRVSSTRTGSVYVEYGMGCGITRQGDVYSFGVLLLEMLTGRRPTDEMFVDGLNLHNFTSSMFPDRIAEILDPHMAHDEEHRLYSEIWMQSHIIPLVALGLSCSMESPKDRPGMQHVCAKLCAIKEAFL